MPATTPGACPLYDEPSRTSPSLRHSRHLLHRTAPTLVQMSVPVVPIALALPDVLGRAESGLPPTPPTISQDGQSSQPPVLAPPQQHGDSVMKSLMSHKSSFGTPVNARSPPTPDPSPPRTDASSPSPSDRPHAFTYPSSHAESFQTAREDLSSNLDSASDTPVGDRLSTVQEDRGLGLAFEHQDEEITPTNTKQPSFDLLRYPDVIPGSEEDQEHPVDEGIPDREWNLDMMRNVTVRKKRSSRPTPIKDAQALPSKSHGLQSFQDPVWLPEKERKTCSPRIDSNLSLQKNAVPSLRHKPDPALVVVEPASPTSSTRIRPISDLRECLEASNIGPITPSVQNFAPSIGWQTEDKGPVRNPPRDVSSKRMSASSTTSTMVEAMVIVTPPRRHQMLRHSGKNMAYRRDVSSPAEFGSDRHSSRNSLHIDDIPLHRLVHKRLGVNDRQKRISTDSGPSVYERPLGQERLQHYERTLGYERNMSPALSLRSTQTMDSSRHTLAHQESIRRVLQPAADILSRTSTVRQSQSSGGACHWRNTSAPESTPKTLMIMGPRNFSQLPPMPQSPPKKDNSSIETREPARPVTPTLSPKPHLPMPASRKQDRTRRPTLYTQSVVNPNMNRTDLPAHTKPLPATPGVVVHTDPTLEDKTVPTGLMDRVRRLIVDHESTIQPALGPHCHLPASTEQPSDDAPLRELSPPIQRASRRWSTHSQERSCMSPEVIRRPGLNRISTEEIARRSHEWRRRSVEFGRVSYDLSTLHSEEHANARHIYAQGTPFSQMSDTLEVSEARAISIYPHNNHSLLVVQQVPRSNSLIPDQPIRNSGTHSTYEDLHDIQPSPTPPFVDASEGHEEDTDRPLQPTLNFEPSTPPMNLDLPQSDAINSPLKVPQPPPQPPMIMFIPPTPAEELERELIPGPPKRSDSHPQRQPRRRARLAQRARRYSDNLITPLLSRASINRRHQPIESCTNSHGKLHVPGVNDEDGTLHPFWRPRGFWDGFEESDDESEGEDALPIGGDTSNIEDDEPTRPPRRTLGFSRKLTNGLRGPSGFLIGNSLGVERNGNNKRRHHITLPPHFPRSTPTPNDLFSPKVSVKSPTQYFDTRGSGGISRTRSINSFQSSISYEVPVRRASWRQGRSLPGIRKYRVQYVGLSGVKENFNERRAEKRRNKLRESIGSKYYVESVGSVRA